MSAFAGMTNLDLPSVVIPAVFKPESRRPLQKASAHPLRV